MSCTGDERIHPIKCALRFDPPTFVLFYTNAETGSICVVLSYVVNVYVYAPCACVCADLKGALEGVVVGPFLYEG